MIKKEAFRVVAKHVFIATRQDFICKPAIILADNMNEALNKAVQFFSTDSIRIVAIGKTEDPQIYFPYD